MGTATTAARALLILSAKLGRTAPTAARVVFRVVRGSATKIAFGTTMAVATTAERVRRMICATLGPTAPTAGLDRR